MVNVLTCLTLLPTGFSYVEPEPPPPEEGVVFSHTFPADGGGGVGYTGRMDLEASALTPPTLNPSKVRLTLRGGSAEGVTYGCFYIGHSAGAGSFTCIPTQVLFSGQQNVSVPAGQEVVSDWVNFAWDKTSNLTFSFYLDSVVDTPARDGGFASAHYYYKVGDDAITVEASGYTDAGNLWDAISKIEMDGF